MLKSLFIDTINYDELGKIYTKLINLQKLYNDPLLPSAIPDPNAAETAKKVTAKDQDGKTIRDKNGNAITYNRPNHCSWCLFNNLDTSAIFGLDFLGALTPSWCTLSAYVLNPKTGQPILEEVSGMSIDIDLPSSTTPDSLSAYMDSLSKNSNGSTDTKGSEQGSERN